MGQEIRRGVQVYYVKRRVCSNGDVTMERYTGKTISILQMFRDYYDRNKSEEALRRQLDAPIAIRARQDIEEELQKLLAQG
jgi:hypothetical protein